MLRGVLTITLLILAVSGMAFAAPIGTVWSEDFEDDTLGSPPGPIWPTLPGWYDYSVGGSQWTTPIVTNSFPETGNLTQHYYDPGYQGSTVTGGAKRWVLTTSADAPVELKFEFDFFVRNISLDRPLRLMLLAVNDDGTWGGAGPGVTINTSEVRIFGGDTDPLVGTALESTWQHFEMSVNTTTETISVSLDGATPVSTTYWRNQPMLNSIWVQRSGGNPAFYFLDNLRLEVIPEPATLGLLAVGGLLALLKRKRR